LIQPGQRGLATSVRRLRAYLDGGSPFTALVTIADGTSTDSTSTDNTWANATALAGERVGVRAVHLGAKTRVRVSHQDAAACDHRPALAVL
jgi:hypothetical protein